MARGIYRITSPTGRVYIGQSINLRSRLWQYKNLYCSLQSFIYCSLKKHGVESHKFDILYQTTNTDPDYLDALEIFYIELYKNSGVSLMNLKEGGLTGRRLPEVRQATIRLAKLKKKKKCCRCKKVLFKKLFHKQKNYCLDGYSYFCIECSKKRAKDAKSKRVLPEKPIPDLPGEIWMPVPKQEDKFMASSCGRIKSLKRFINHNNGKTNSSLNYDKLLKPRTTEDNMVMVKLDGKDYSLPRLITKIFIPNPENLRLVENIDGNKFNNYVSNLKWISPKEKSKTCKLRFLYGKEHPQAKKINQYTKHGVFIKTWDSGGDIGRELGVTPETIYHCCKGRTKTSHGFIWKYTNDARATTTN